MPHTAILLIFAVLAVGVLHTLVPDHWVPITLMARQRGWSRIQTARAAAGAGLGHTVSTLVIALVVWTAGVAFAARFAHVVNLVTSVALMAFGGWVAFGAARELREDRQHSGTHDDLEDEKQGHAHLHKHQGNLVHVHWHVHGKDDWHEVEGNLALAPPIHDHEHSASARTALLLVLGSSPMVEGIPAFFAAARYGTALIVIMSLVFAASTIATYVGLCVASTSGFQRINLGPLEKYGEVISGLFIAVLGLIFLFIK